MRLSDKTTLFFIAGVTPTTGEQSLIDGIDGNVKVRSVLKDDAYANGARLEAADYVAGAVPADYLAAYPFLPVIWPTEGTFTAAGDSRTNGTLTSTANNLYLEANYPLAWAMNRCGGKMEVNGPDDYGVGGDTSTDLLARWSTVLADDAQNIFLLIGVNDRGGADMTLAATIANVEQMLDEAGEAGKRIWLANEMPREGVTAGQEANHIAFSRWCSDPQGALFRRPWVFPVDTWQAVADDTASNTFLNGMDVDGLHLLVVGAARVGLGALAPAVYAGLQNVAAYELANDETDLFDATTNPTGTLNTNAGLTGTGGSGGSNTAGNFADDFVASVNGAANNALFTGSKETDPDGNEWQVITISGTPDSDEGRCEFRIELDPADFSDGDIYEVGALVQWEDLVNVNGCWLETYFDDGTVYRSRSLDQYNNTRPSPANSKGTMFMRTPPSFAIPDASALSNVRAALNIQTGAGAVASSGVIKVAKFTARKKVS